MATNVYLKQRIEERHVNAEVLREMQETAARENRHLTEAEQKTFDSITASLKDLDSEIERISRSEAGAAKFMEIYGAHKAAEERASQAHSAAVERRPSPRVEVRSWGQRFVDSDQFRSFGGRGSSQPFTIEGQRWLEERSNGGNGTPTGLGPITSGDFSGADADIVRPAQWWSGPAQPQFRTPLFDVIGRVPTNLGSVEYLYIHQAGDLDTDMAQEVPEGEVKPEAPFEAELKALPMATYAWWRSITRQALEDVPQIQATLDTYLRRGVQRRIERDAAAQLLADTEIPTLSGTLLAAIREGIAIVDDNGYSPNAVALNPHDFADLDVDLLVLTGGPGVGGTPVMGRSFWGIVPVPVPGIPAGTAYVGDFREGMTWFDRDVINVVMTDSHQDFFVRNLLVLLAEARGRVVVTNAMALAKVTVTGTISEFAAKTGTTGSSTPTSTTTTSSSSGAGGVTGGRTRRPNGGTEPPGA